MKSFKLRIISFKRLKKSNVKSSTEETFLNRCNITYASRIAFQTHIRFWTQYLAIVIVTCSLSSCFSRSSLFLAVIGTVRSSGEVLPSLRRFLALLCCSVVDGKTTEHTSNSTEVRLGVRGLAVKLTVLTSVAISTVSADRTSSMTLRNSWWTCFCGSGVAWTREDRVALDDVLGLAITADSETSTDTFCPFDRTDRSARPFLFCAK